MCGYLYGNNRGAFSFVFRAKDTVTGKQVAVKVVRKKELNASEVSLNIIQQAKLNIFIMLARSKSLAS